MCSLAPQNNYCFLKKKNGGLHKHRKDASYIEIQRCQGESSLLLISSTLKFLKIICMGIFVYMYVYALHACLVLSEAQSRVLDLLELQL